MEIHGNPWPGSGGSLPFPSTGLILQPGRYCLRNTHLSAFQRSFVDSKLRRALGDKRVAFLIFQHGLPSIANLPPHTKFDMGMLQSGLEECLQWYVALANDIVAHHQSASAMDEEERQRRCREALQKAFAMLAEPLRRPSKKRIRDDMGDDMDDAYEDYVIKKAKLDFTAPNLKPFRCKLPNQELKCNAAEHASSGQIQDDDDGPQ